MYSFNAHILCIACPEEIVRTLKDITPPPAFSYKFAESESLGEDFAFIPDLVIMGPSVSEEEIEGWKGDPSKTDLILFADPDRDISEKSLSRLKDVWPYPLSTELVRFYFKKWQESIKREKDHWQTTQYLEKILETSPNLIWFKSKEGIHELVNASFCRTVGKSREDVQGKRHAYIWNVEQDDPACIESERAVMESGETHSAEEEIETGSGRRILTTFKSPLCDLDGSMMGTVGIGVDVTQERLYQNQLIRNNEILETIFTTMDCGVICQSLDGNRVISVNRAALRLLDHNSREDLEYNGFHMVASTVLDEDKPKLMQAISRLENVGDNVSFEYRVRHSSGRVLHIMGSAKLVEKDGEILCQRFLLDCTDQKLAAKREQDERERRQKELIHALAIDYQLVFVIDSKTEEGMILQLRQDPDPQLFNIFSNDQSLGDELKHYIENCVHPDDREALSYASSMPALQEALRYNKICYFHYRVMNGNDVMYYQMKAVRAGKSESAYNIIIGLQSVNERTRHEMEQKAALAEALKEAKKASTAKSIFLSNMSHDIRTPMNAVVGYTGLALAQLDNREQVRAYLEKILTSGKHLISLINDILNMSHIESGKVQLEEKPCNLNELLQELWNIVHPTAAAKRHEFTFDLENIRHVEILCDRLRLKQVLLNLLGNSVKYTPDGGKISMLVRELPCAGSCEVVYEFRIKDNGIGMSEEFQSRIFDPFERAQTSTIAGIEGTGLGMAITKNIVLMMQGDIEVYSKLDVGTEFVLRAAFETIPEMSVEDEALPLPEAQSKDEQEIIPRARHAGRILLTEDNSMNQEIACEFLSGAGYEVDVASNGQEAVTRLQEAGPGYYDVVLMDVQMPVLDGYGATELIRAFPNPELANVPIIAMTANSFDEDRAEAMRRGMNGHIAKPIDFPLLFGTLDALLGGKNSHKNIVNA